MKLKRMISLILLVGLVPYFVVTALADVTVRYYSNGGKPDFDSFTVVPDESGVISFSHPEDEPTRKGYVFLGWLCEDEARFYPMDPAGKDIRYQMADGTLTYAAQWMPNDHPACAPIMMATALAGDGTLYDVVEGQWKCVQMTDKTFYCLHDWYYDSGEFRDIVDGSGYAGFQCKNGSTYAILSIWSNENGDPTIEYARPGSQAEPFSGEGTGMHVITEYPLNLFTWYTMRIQARTWSGKTYYDQYVCPEGGEWELIASISFPRPGLGFTLDSFFQEDWSANNLPRSSLIRRYCGRKQHNHEWRPVDSFCLTNAIRGTDEINVRYDCRYDYYGEDAVWIQSGGGGYDTCARDIPAQLAVTWDGVPSAKNFLR